MTYAAHDCIAPKLTSDPLVPLGRVPLKVRLLAQGVLGASYAQT